VENRDRKNIYACKEVSLSLCPVEEFKKTFAHFRYQSFSNPRKNVENTENFIYVIFIVPIFTKPLNAQRRCVGTFYAEFYIKWK